MPNFTFYCVWFETEGGFFYLDFPFLTPPNGPSFLLPLTCPIR